MASAAQIEANQRSAKRSTGPKTPKGSGKREMAAGELPIADERCEVELGGCELKTPRKAPNEACATELGKGGKDSNFETFR